MEPLSQLPLPWWAALVIGLVVVLAGPTGAAWVGVKIGLNGLRDSVRSSTAMRTTQRSGSG